MLIKLTNREARIIRCLLAIEVKRCWKEFQDASEAAVFKELAKDNGEYLSSLTDKFKFAADWKID